MSEAVRLAVVQKRGQITIPIDLRRKMGIEEGGIVAFVETEDGLLLSPRKALALDALNRIEQALGEQGITLDDLIESGREIRGQLLKEEYGLTAEPPE
jgi:AbrB family looped-hinge helix DNA binding protein